MAHTELETESKFELADDADVPSLVSLPRVASVADPVAQELEATYFDTPDLALAAAGVTVRRRTGGDDAGWHVKLPTADGRFEVHEPLGRSTKTVPKQLRLVLQTITRDAVLEPVATVRTRRTVHRLLDDHNGVLAEVSDDRVTSQSSGERTPRAWRELEVELVDADASLLDRAARLLGKHGLQPSTTGSKLRRALGDRVPSTREKPGAGRTTASTGVVHARLAGLAADMRALDPLVRADAPDSVHRMRVTTRRLRNALATFRPLLDREVTDPVRDDVKWVAGVLGEARDAEVLRKRLLRQLDEEPPAVVRGRVREFIDDDLRRRYVEAHRLCLLNMQSDRYLKLIDRLDEIAKEPPWADDARHQGQDFLKKRVRHDFKRLERRIESTGHAHDEADYTRRLHETRKAAKRMRYAIEPIVPVHGKKARKLAKAMKRVQSVLGDHQDGAVTRDELRRLSDRATSAGVNAYAVGILDIRQEQHVAEQRDRFGPAWKKASRKKLRAWLS